ncbi:MAG: hypothetical protein QXE01_02795 [Sulfolobales archaeon]
MLCISVSFSDGFPVIILGLLQIVSALYILSHIYEERRVFWYSLISVTLYIPPSVVLFLFPLHTSLFALLFTQPRDLEVFTSIVSSLGVYLVIAASVSIAISGFLWYRALEAVSTRLGKILFRWSGLITLVSIILQALSIIEVYTNAGLISTLIAYSYLIELVGWISLITAFYSFKP